ncbi:hypothetical protein JRY29_07750 [Salmonella enterica subsp. enterica serovar Kentucky]|nr:hypothetical protein JRY29_07750 [Salmonella enterica subsp. enterica serovar Kentucky]
MLDDLSANRFIPLAREYEEEGMPELVDAGLSPLARGILHITRNTGITAGLSRWRGSTDKADTEEQRRRFIPLAREYANNQHQIQPFPVYPAGAGILQIYPANSRSVRFIRWRGEYWRRTGNYRQEIGLSRWRGEYGPLRNPNGLVAGLSRWRGEYAHASTRHIKSCGLSRWRGEYGSEC